jgi:hypothetical protein
MSDHEPDRSPIVANLARVLDFIQKRSILYLLLRWRGLHDQDRFVDRYVMACTVLAPCMYLASFVPLPLTLLKVGLAAILIFVSAWRIIELVTFHLNMLIARPGRPGGVSSVASYERTFIFALANYLEVTFWFATWYSIAVRQGAFQEVQGPLLLSIFRESLAMMLVNSSGLFKPRASWCLWAAICFQSVVGLFLTLLVLARAVAMLPPPEEDKKKSQKDGQTSLGPRPSRPPRRA